MELKRLFCILETRITLSEAKKGYLHFISNGHIFSRQSATLDSNRQLKRQLEYLNLQLLPKTANGDFKFVIFAVTFAINYL